MTQTKGQSFFLGVFGFLATATIVFLVYFVLNATYRDGYDAGFKCAKYEICR